MTIFCVFWFIIQNKK